MRYTLVMTRVKIEYMLFAAMLLVAGAAYGRGPVVAVVAVARQFGGKKHEDKLRHK